MIGQETTVQILKAIIKSKSYQSAYMFSGPSGVGKTTSGRAFAKAILCDNPQDGNPCNVCESCSLFNKEQNFGYRELDSASFGGKEDMVKLRDEAMSYPVGKKKIIHLDECHDISRQGQDALLKQVEQCPDHLIYIFSTTDPDKVNDTLRKRCMQFQISRVDHVLISNRLSEICEIEGMAYDKEALDAIAWESHGHVRDSINILEEVAYLGNITLDNFNKISKNIDEDLCKAISGLGNNLKESLDSFKAMFSVVSVSEIYDQMVGMLNDASKLLFGYNNFIPQRLSLVEKIRDIHGDKVLEFLNYLVQRNKIVDRISFQSDIVLMHYKFCSGSFEVPSDKKIQNNSSASIAPVKEEVPSQKNSTPVETGNITHAQLHKMGIGERNRTLRNLRSQSSQNKLSKDESVEKVLDWSLPEEERLGESNSDDEELSPEEFSRNLVGGMGDWSKKVAHN